MHLVVDHMASQRGKKPSGAVQAPEFRAVEIKRRLAGHRVGVRRRQYRRKSNRSSLVANLKLARDPKVGRARRRCGHRVDILDRANSGRKPVDREKVVIFEVADEHRVHARVRDVLALNRMHVDHEPPAAEPALIDLQLPRGQSQRAMMMIEQVAAGPPNHAGRHIGGVHAVRLGRSLQVAITFDHPAGRLPFRQPAPEIRNSQIAGAAQLFCRDLRIERRLAGSINDEGRVEVRHERPHRIDESDLVDTGLQGAGHAGSRKRFFREDVEQGIPVALVGLGFGGSYWFHAHRNGVDSATAQRLSTGRRRPAAPGCAVHVPLHVPSIDHRRAVRWLVFGTAAWGLSFPVQKMLTALGQQAVPEAGTWFLTSWIICVRSTLAAVMVLAWRPHLLRGLTRAERFQGLWLGLTGGGGLVLQADGLAHTSASTSAFLTQAYCILLPLWQCFQKRAAPGARLVVSTGLVIWGIIILSGFNWSTLHMGRGEWETLGAALCFTAQIILLERPAYAANRPLPVTALMLVGFAAWSLPIALATTPTPGALLATLSTPAAWAHLLVLAAVCSALAYGLMIAWQPKIPATEAGLIYCFEPVCASLFALFLPGWLSHWTGVPYPNESLTTALITGGLLITAANTLLQIGGRQPATTDPR